MTEEPRTATSCRIPGPRPFSSTDELRGLVEAFEVGTLPRERWTHQSHLAVALWYLVWYGSQAGDRMREGIKRYNAAQGIAQTATSGYHETLTRFYMWAVQRQLRGCSLEGTLADLANDIVQALNDKSYPLAYYSRERLMSMEARMSWLEPDLRPLRSI